VPRTLFACLLIMNSMNACSVFRGSPSPNECAWVSLIILDDGYETRLTTAEKQQILAHDEAVERICHR
jgi:hypothetical protein